jgi:hypothetical protein
MIAAVQFMGNTDVIAFRPFTAPDFAEFEVAPDHGVQAKEFVRDSDGAAWLIKSGALGREHPPNLSDEEERSRRAAFPIHEARLGFRTMSAWGEKAHNPTRLLPSHARRRTRRDCGGTRHHTG